MSSASTRGSHLLLRGYGPLIAFMVFFALMAALVPTIGADDTGTAASAPTSESDLGGPEDLQNGDATAIDGVASVATDTDAEVGNGVEDAQTSTTSSATGDESAGADEQQASAPAEGVEGCADRELQVPGDPYSPPCVSFDGDNGGETARGVSADEIVISARTPDAVGFQDALSEMGDGAIADSQEDVRRTISGLVEYFNERFELYGRQLRVEFFDGTGDTMEESLGRGQADAQADALTVSGDIGAFAEINGSTEPFGDALAREGVIAIGAPHLSGEWMEGRAPYAWSPATDCSIIARSSSEFGNVRLRGGDAEYAEGDLQGRPRKMATVVPENPVYQQCLAAAEEAARDAGFEPPMSISYTLDIGTMSNQAANIVARLQNEQVTTVTCSCDPVLPVFLTARAQEQGYHPEWIVTGSGFTDQDVVGQLMNQDQWSRAFGISYNAAAQPMEATLGYNAYKQVRDDEPAFAVNSMYASLYLLAIGIQGAGPELTPETFQQGMFDYPGGDGPAGTWGFGPGNYSAPENFREIYWDPQATSNFNGQPGAYVETDPGVRHFPGQLPEGGPRVPW